MPNTQRKPKSQFAVINIDSVINRVAAGDMLRDIANDIGTTPQAICNKLSTIPEYQQAREIGAAMRLERDYSEIRAAAEQVDVSRAREAFRASSWFAEREFPHRWGRTVEVTNVSGDLGDRLRRASERVINPAPQQITDNGTQVIDSNADSDV